MKKPTGASSVTLRPKRPKKFDFVMPDHSSGGLCTEQAYWEIIPAGGFHFWCDCGAFGWVSDDPRVKK